MVRTRNNDKARRRSGLVVLGVVLFIIGIAMVFSPNPAFEASVAEGGLVDSVWSRPVGIGFGLAGMTLLIVLLKPPNRGPLA